MRLVKWSYAGEFVELFYPDGSMLKVMKTDFDRAFGTIISATKETIARDFAV